MRAGLSFSRSPISLLLRQPLSIKKSYAGAIQSRIFLNSGTLIVIMDVPLTEALHIHGI
jgi:hypothetical protein